MKRLTPDELRAATAKRVATQAANRAAGIPSVKQQRAAAKAAKLGQTYTPPAPAPSASSSTASPFGRRRRRFGSSRYTAPPAPVSSGPVFAPRPTYRALKLAALAALEAAFVAKLEEAGGVAALTDDTRSAFARYKAVKARALATQTSASATTAQALATANEDNAALTVATIALLKLAY